MPLSVMMTSASTLMAIAATPLLSSLLVRLSYSTRTQPCLESLGPNIHAYPSLHRCCATTPPVCGGGAACPLPHTHRCRALKLDHK